MMMMMTCLLHCEFDVCLDENNFTHRRECVCWTMTGQPTKNYSCVNCNADENLHLQMTWKIGNMCVKIRCLLN